MGGDPRINDSNSSTGRTDAGRPRGSRWALGVWLGYWAALFVATHTPVPAGPPMGRFTDKAIHFVLYLILALLAGGWCLSAGRAASARAAPTRTLIAWAAVLTLYAAFDEWLQQFVGRSMSVGDFLADLAGVAIAAVFLLWRRRRRPISRG